MNRTIIISEAQLKAQSPIGDNVDSKYLNSRIWNCQNKYIRPLLGDDLYNDLLNNYTANTLTNAYTSLLNDYLTPCLVNYVVYDVLPVIHFKINNAGVNYRQDTNIVPASLEEITMLADKFKNEAEWFSERTTKHLFYYPDLFPLYLNANVELDKQKPTFRNYNSGVYVGQGGKNIQQNSIGIFKEDNDGKY